MSLLVPATVVVAVGSTEASRIIHRGVPSMKPVIGGFLLGLGLFALDAIDHRLASLFCVLVIVGSLLVNGLPIFTFLNTGKGSS